MGNAPVYSRPSSIDEALSAINNSNDSALKILAGGTDLIIQMRAGLQSPEHLLDIKQIPEATAITIGADHIRIGAAVSFAQLCDNSKLRQQYPGVIEGLELVGSTQVQSRATLGGNLCNASPAADSVPALIAANAECLVIGPNGQRQVAVSDICLGPGKTSLKSNEFILEFILPIPAPSSADAYLRFTPRNEMDIAVVGVATNLTLDQAGVCTQARVVIGAIAPTVLIADEIANVLIGQKLDEAVIKKAGQIASQLGSPISDKRGTTEFRHQIAGVLTRRTIKIAMARTEQNR